MGRAPVTLSLVFNGNFYYEKKDQGRNSNKEGRERNRRKAITLPETVLKISEAHNGTNSM